jgi:iron complex outermembrane receptor protein
MMETILSRSIRVICLGGLAVGMGAACAQEMQTQQGQNQSGAAQQQAEAQAPGGMQRVEVTGSRLRSPNADSPSPLQVLSAADIAASGATNLQQVLLDNPTMGSPAISRTNSAFQTASVGVATVDLRNLGTSRTLVLVNGRRFVSGIPGESAVDLNSIPTDFHRARRTPDRRRLGSLRFRRRGRRGQHHHEAQLQRRDAGRPDGESSKNDDQKRKFSATFGTSNDNGFLMGHLGYSRQGQVWSRDRERSAVDQQTRAASTGKGSDLFTVDRPFYSSFAPQGRFLPRRRQLHLRQANGNVIPVNTNGTNGGQATGFNRNEFRSIAVPVERYLFATNGELKINEKTRAFMEGTYASSPCPPPSNRSHWARKTSSRRPAARCPPAPWSTACWSRTRWCRSTCTTASATPMATAFPTTTSRRRLSEVGTRGSTADRDTFRFVTGVKGEFDAWKTWNYEVYGGYGQTKEAQQSTGQVNVMNFANALQAVPGDERRPADAPAPTRAHRVACRSTCSATTPSRRKR